MPWKETYAMKERLKLVSLYETGRYTVTELAQHFGVSRKTVHKWLERFAEDKDAWLVSFRSFPSGLLRPHHSTLDHLSPNQTTHPNTRSVTYVSS